LGANGVGEPLRVGRDNFFDVHLNQI